MSKSIHTPANVVLELALDDNKTLQFSRAAMTDRGKFEKTLQRVVLIVSLTFVPHAGVVRWSIG